MELNNYRLYNYLSEEQLIEEAVEISNDRDQAIMKGASHQVVDEYNYRRQIVLDKIEVLSEQRKMEQRKRN